MSNSNVINLCEYRKRKELSVDRKYTKEERMEAKRTLIGDDDKYILEMMEEYLKEEAEKENKISRKLTKDEEIELINYLEENEGEYDEFWT